jgi:hypothetical protein
MTPERAQEVLRAGNQFPEWGNYHKFMTPEENAELQRLWLRQPGEWSRASVLYAIARGRPLK